jgi:hypothetical protein
LVDFIDEIYISGYAKIYEVRNEKLLDASANLMAIGVRDEGPIKRESYSRWQVLDRQQTTSL